MAIPISKFIVVNITAGSASLEADGFGIPLIFAYFPTTYFATRTKTYNGSTILTEMAADGFPTSHPAYLMAQALIRGDRKPETIIVGRRANAPVQAIDLTVATTTAEISVKVSYLGVSETYPITGTGVPATDATSLANAITAGVWGVGTEIAASASGPTVSIVQGASPDTGQIFYFDELANVTLDDASASPDIEADILAIETEDDSWYWVVMDSYSGAENLALEVAITAREKVAWIQTQDYDVATASANNILEEMVDDNTDRVTPQWARYSMAEYSNAYMVGYACTLNPGAWSGSWVPMVGVTPDGVITDTEFTNITDQYGAVYLKMSNIGANMKGGRTPSGSWIDLTQLTDWLRENIRVGLANALIRNAQLGTKIPYTDAAGEIAIGVIGEVYERGARNGGFVLSDFSATYLEADSQVASDKDNRLFNGVEFSGTLTSAVVEFNVAGRLV